METRSLGKSGPQVSAIGLGCMPMSGLYGRPDREEAVAALERALDVGMTFLDTADIYGLGHNEEHVGRVIRGRRDKVVLGTKFSIIASADRRTFRINGQPDHVFAACDASLKRLGVDEIDIYYQHRVDPEVPIEDTVGAMARLVEQGKVHYLGLSEASAGEIRRAAEVHTITALQSEYSLWTRDVEEEILAVCRELEIGFVAYSPLGRGFLTGTIKTRDALDDNDWRKSNPRFAEDNFDRNLALVDTIEGMASDKGCTAAQLALAWVLAQGDDVIPIPGTKRRKYVEENAQALNVDFTEDELAQVSAAFPPGTAHGERYEVPKTNT